MPLFEEGIDRWGRSDHSVAWRELECSLHYLCYRGTLIKEKYENEYDDYDEIEYLFYAIFGIRYYVHHAFAINLDHFLGATPTQDKVEKYNLTEIQRCLVRIYIFDDAYKKGTVKETIKQAIEEGIIDKKILRNAGGIIKAEKFIVRLFKV